MGEQGDCEGHQRVESVLRMAPHGRETKVGRGRERKEQEEQKQVLYRALTEIKTLHGVYTFHGICFIPK